MFDGLGFGLASAVLLVTFGKLITASWFSYLMVAIIHFQVAMAWLGLKRPLTSEDDDRYQDIIDAEHFRHDTSNEKRSRSSKKNPKTIEINCD